MKFIFGNWKMNLLREQAIVMAKTLAQAAVPQNTEVTVFPSFTALSIIIDLGLTAGGQDCSSHEGGAFTGEISAAMLKDAGCKYVLLGHSERRQYHKEPDELVRAKAEAAIQAGLIPVICVGENLTEREAGNHLARISSQAKASVPLQGNYIIAYEPVWAIGSGRIPTLAEITQAHKTIASALSYATSGSLVAIIYGGSVKSCNASDILHAEGVDGVLVGGASLDAQEFQSIIAAAQQK